VGTGPGHRRWGEHRVWGGRQGAPGDAFLALGDCTPFTPSGSRGTLNGQPVGFTGAPAACFVSFGGQAGPATVNQVPCTFSFDLNTGKVTLGGSFPDLPSSLDFTVEFVHRFDGSGGENMLFHSEKTSDHAGTWSPSSWSRLPKPGHLRPAAPALGPAGGKHGRGAASRR
jgi:hypothetical protein